MKYNKEPEKTKRSRVIRGGSGPRDLQRKHKEANAVVELNTQLELLVEKLTQSEDTREEHTSDKKYSEEEVNAIVNEAVRDVVAPIEDAAAKDVAEANIEIERLRTEINSVKAVLVNTRAELNTAKMELVVVKSKLDSKDELLKVKDATISTLKDRPVNVNVSGAVVTDSIEQYEDRPEMETVFIDPTEKRELSPHLKFNDVHLEEKGVMVDKVSKLKNLLGGLHK